MMQSDERQFPMLLDHRELRELGLTQRPRVPWAWLEPHEDQALQNHGQTLQRLAERGGLDPREMLSIITGKKWSAYQSMSLEEAMQKINDLVAQWKQSRNDNNNPAA